MSHELTEEERAILIRERAQAYYALEELSDEINCLQDLLKPLILEQIKLRHKFKMADIALAKVTRVEVDVKKRNYATPQNKQTAKLSELADLISKVGVDKINELFESIGG